MKTKLPLLVMFVFIIEGCSNPRDVGPAPLPPHDTHSSSSSGSSSHSGGGSDPRDVDQLDIEQHIRGLANDGVDCFINAAIQSISKQEWLSLLGSSRTNAIIEAIDKIKTETNKNELSSELDNYLNFMNHAAPTIRRWLSGESIDATKLRKALLSNITSFSEETRTWGTQGRSSVQGDAREVFRHIYDSLLVKYTDPCQIAQRISSDELDKESKTDHRPEHILEIPVSQSTPKLSDAVSAYTSQARVPDYKWDDDSIASDTIMQCKFKTLPQRLKINLKRDKASFTSQGRFVKTTYTGNVKIDNLTLNSLDGTNKTYECDSAICYTGSGKSGHYYAYRKIEGQWYEFNDSRVTPVDKKVALGDISKHAVHVSMLGTTIASDTEDSLPHLS